MSPDPHAQRLLSQEPLGVVVFLIAGVAQCIARRCRGLSAALRGKCIAHVDRLAGPLADSVGSSTEDAARITGLERNPRCKNVK